MYILCYLTKSNFTPSAQVIILYNEFENYTFKKSLPCLPGVNELMML